MKSTRPLVVIATIVGCRLLVSVWHSDAQGKPPAPPNDGPQLTYPMSHLETDRFDVRDTKRLARCTVWTTPASFEEVWAWYWKHFFITDGPATATPPAKPPQDDDVSEVMKYSSQEYYFIWNRHIGPKYRFGSLVNRFDEITNLTVEISRGADENRTHITVIEAHP